MLKKLLSMLGGLPSEPSPLHARITGKIAMDGFHVEKLSGPIQYLLRDGA